MIGPTLEEAYEQLNEALNAVRQKHSSDFFTGPNFGATTLATAQTILAQLQMALLIKMDGIDPASLKDKKQREIILRLSEAEADALAEFVLESIPPMTMDEAAKDIIVAQLTRLGLLAFE